MVQGKLADALKSYQARQEIILRLASSDPSNAAWQCDLSVSFNKIGDVEVNRGDLADGLKSYNDSLAIFGTPRQIQPRQCGVAARSRGEL